MHGFSAGVTMEKFKNIAKSFADMLTEPSASLRDHVFMPVLWKRHFPLLWYCKKNNEVILYDSTNPVDTYVVSSKVPCKLAVKLLLISASAESRSRG